MTPLIIQSEASECGIACLTMILRRHGCAVDLHGMRQRYGSTAKGMTLSSLINLADLNGLTARPLKLELAAMDKLELPCILHWDLNHFVVLVKVGRRSITVLDPAIGRRKLKTSEASQHFTGIALELTPVADFRHTPERPRLSIRALTGKITGLWRILAQVLLVALILELFAILAPLLPQFVVDEVIAAGDRQLLIVLVLGFGLLISVQTVIGLARSWMLVVLNETVALQWASNVFSHLLKLPIEFFERRHLGDVSSRFGAVKDIRRTLTTEAVEATLDGLMSAAALVMMLVYSARLAMVTMCAVSVYCILRVVSFRLLRDISSERLVWAAKEHSHFLETLRAMTPIKLFGRQAVRHAQWKNTLIEMQGRDFRISLFAAFVIWGNTFIFGVENILVLWIGADIVLGGVVGGLGNGGFSIGMLFAYISYKSQFISRFVAFVNYLVELRMLGVHTERLADICLQEPEKDDVQQSDLEHLAPEIELRGVSFRYGEGEPWLLKDVSFKLAAGECVAVVGASGAGKTTLLKVMLGLLKPTEGDVLYGGHSVKELGLQNFRKQIGTVMQEDVLLTGTLAENITFFDMQPDQSWVESCAQMAQLHKDIMRMPMGYQTLVGDLGSGLSGGQRQRLLLARALYKRPKVLALDEATSHLDIANERAVTGAISHMRLSRLIIAHRHETIGAAERVVELKDGRVSDLAWAASAVG